VEHPVSQHRECCYGMVAWSTSRPPQNLSDPAEMGHRCDKVRRMRWSCTLRVGLRSYGSRRGEPDHDRAAETESDIPPRQLVQGSDVDIAPLAGVAAAFTRWWLGRLGAISDDLVKRPAGEIRQLTLHSLDVFPQRVGR
jgi:hypothetical protein